MGLPLPLGALGILDDVREKARRGRANAGYAAELGWRLSAAGRGRYGEEASPDLVDDVYEYQAAIQPRDTGGVDGYLGRKTLQRTVEDVQAYRAAGSPPVSSWGQHWAEMLVLPGVDAGSGGSPAPAPTPGGGGAAPAPAPTPGGGGGSPAPSPATKPKGGGSAATTSKPAEEKKTPWGWIAGGVALLVGLAAAAAGGGKKKRKKGGGR